MKSQVMYIRDRWAWFSRQLIVTSVYRVRAVQRFVDEKLDMGVLVAAFHRLRDKGVLMPQVIGPGTIGSKAKCRLWRMKGHKPQTFDTFFAREWRRREELEKHITRPEPAPVKAKDIRKAWAKENAVTGRPYGRA